MTPANRAPPIWARMWRLLLAAAAILAAFADQHPDQGTASPGGSAEARSLLIHNEQVKTRATLVNSLANACIGAGGISQVAVLVFGTTPAHRSFWIMGVGALMLLAVGWMLHRQAVHILKGLRA